MLLCAHPLFVSNNFCRGNFKITNVTNAIEILNICAIGQENNCLFTRTADFCSLAKLFCPG